MKRKASVVGVLVAGMVGACDGNGPVGSNEPPVLDAPAISPAAAYNDSTLSCTATASDPDDDDLVVTREWTNVARGASLGSTEAITLTPSDASPGEAIRCEVVASDGELTDSAFADTTLINRTPTVQTPTITPADPSPRSVLTCAASAADADGSTPTVTYAWANETRSTALGTESSVTLNRWVAATGDVIQCTVTASDGVASAQAVASTALVDSPNRFDGAPLIFAVNKQCGSSTWTYELTTDGLASGVTLEVTNLQFTSGTTEVHVLSAGAHDMNWDGAGSPSVETTNEDAAEMDPLDDANNDLRPDWGWAVPDYVSQPFDDADGKWGSWDQWTVTMPVVSPGSAVVAGDQQSSAFGCTLNDFSTLSWKITMYGDDGDPVDCVIFGRNSQQQFGTDCACIDPDSICTDSDKTP